MSTIYIRSLLNELVDTIIDKWVNITDSYSRLVMKRTDWCSVCDDIYTGEQTKTLHVDSSRGRSLYGWLLCKRCHIYEKLIKQYYYKHYCNFIPATLCKCYKDNYFNFYRKSSNPAIQPYIQTKAFYKHHNYDFITIDKPSTHVYVQVSWLVNNIEFTKIINLSNLIFYNRNIFGYAIQDFTIQDLSTVHNLFPKGIIREYNHSNEWHILSCIFYRMRINKHIPDLIQKNIFTFWNDLFIFPITLQ